MKKPFQATAVRYVHDVLTGEFVNIGVVLLCPEASYLGASFLPQWSRVTAAFPNAELSHLRRIATTIESACAAARPAMGQPALWREDADILTVLSHVITREDAAIQLSPVLRGITDDPARTLAELRRRYVEKYIPEETGRETRSEGQVWQDFARRLGARGALLRTLVPHTLRSPRLPGYQYEFEKAWKNGKWNIAQPVSLDLLDPRVIREKATLWTGRIITLKPSEQDALVWFLVGMPPSHGPEALRRAAADAVEILRENLAEEAQVLTEDRSDELVDRIERELAHR